MGKTLVLSRPWSRYRRPLPADPSAGNRHEDRRERPPREDADCDRDLLVERRWTALRLREAPVVGEHRPTACEAPADRPGPRPSRQPSRALELVVEELHPKLAEKRRGQSPASAPFLATGRHSRGGAARLPIPDSCPDEWSGETYACGLGFRLANRLSRIAAVADHFRRNPSIQRFTF